MRGGTERSHHGETSEALYLASGFVYDTAAQGNARTAGEEAGYVYGRFGNPTVTMFEDRLALIEGADACQATATGMAAVFGSLMSQLRAGDHVVASRVMFGACYVVIDQLLPRYGIETDLVDGTDLDAWERAASGRRPAASSSKAQATRPCRSSTSPRSPPSPTASAPASSWTTCSACRPFSVPLALGADVVVYSTTKHIDGQGRCLGGAVLGDEAYFADDLVPFMRTTGPIMSPFNAWVMLKGLETLELRTARMCETAERLAAFLASHPAVDTVHYPGLESHPQHALAARQMSRGGSVIAFDLAGGWDAAFRFLDALELIDISNNLGDAKSLATHPASTTHQKIGADVRATLGIGDGLVRFSVGLEAEADLRADLQQALTAAEG